MGMYEYPIKIIYGQMQTQLEGDILKAVMRTDIQVDKEELIRALQYDRDQYERGFADGYMNAQQELVRCKDCKHWDWRENNPTTVPYFCNAEALYVWGRPARKADDFCSYGERKDNG